jgi:putative tryptophan/tyrosine transport system substrate-binding protein
MKRRDFIALTGTAAVAWPLAARAQQAGQVRRIGALMSFAAADPEAQLRVAAFEDGMREAGWVKGRNLRIEYRWADSADLLRPLAAELVRTAPDLILANSTPVMAALQEQRPTVPIVFTQVTDPVGQGLVANLAHPGGNLTGFTTFEFSIGTKWLETLKEVAPNVKRAALLFNPATAPFANLFWRPIEVVGPSFSITPVLMAARNTDELERMTEEFAREPDGGLMVVPEVSTVNHRGLIIALAARHRLPAVYPYRSFTASGGLLSYGADVADIFRRAATYVDRIFKGASPGELPILPPVKYELSINLKTAKALGLDLPPFLVARADEVIE